MPWKPDEEGEFPTLGYEVARWIAEHCIVPDGEAQGEPFEVSTWQLKFLVHFYRLNLEADPDLPPSRSFRYDRGGQLVGPQKCGKGPLAAAMVCAEAYGPVVFDGWDARGKPVGRPWKTPYIQVTAVSYDQTDNVWRVLQPMIEMGDLKADIPDTGLTRINLPDGGIIEPVTSKARSRLGQRITFVPQDEAHSWDERNGGRRLADTQRRNLAGMGGRFMELGNAWDPNDNSVAQQTWELETGVYKMFLTGGEGSIRNKRERMKVLKELYGDSWWVDPERISSEIDNLLGRGEVAQAERFFMNRIVPGEDRAFNSAKWNEAARPDQPLPKENALIVIGVDGARYEDALAIVCTDIETGFQWLAGLWTKPQNASDDYEHPLHEVDEIITDLFERYDVWRLYGDPGAQYANISILIEKWQGRWTEKRVVAWMMNRPRVAAMMVRNYAAAIESGDVTHDGNKQFAQHIKNARRKKVLAYDEDGHQLWTITKEAPFSLAKIDAAAAGALSWEARCDAIASGAKPSKRKSAYADQMCKCGNPDRPHLKATHRL